MSWNYDAQQKHNRRTGGLASRPQRSATILIVEDDDNLRNILHRALEGHGFSVFPAAEGAEALRLCREHTIDLVVTDIVLPGLSGLELSERIRAVRPDLKFLFITGFGDQFPELSELIKSGAKSWKSHFFLRNSCVKSKTRSTWASQPQALKDSLARVGAKRTDFVRSAQAPPAYVSYPRKFVVNSAFRLRHSRADSFQTVSRRVDTMLSTVILHRLASTQGHSFYKLQLNLNGG